MGNQSLHVLRGVDMDIESGELVSIMGASGSGKSTLLNIIGILDDHDDGDYTLDGREISKLSETAAAEVRNRHIGFVFQSFNLLNFKNAAENVALPLYYQGVRRRKRNSIAMGYLERVGLLDWADHLPGEMSGGQRQRVAIARALIAEPSIILADEPTGALDSKTGVVVLQAIENANRELGTTTVLITHNAAVADMANRVVMLADGAIAETRDNKHRRPARELAW